MSFSSLIDPQSDLSPAHQVVFLARFDLTREAGRLLDLMKSGQLPYNPADRSPDQGWSVLDLALTSAGSEEHFAQALPLLDWLVSQGLSPWEEKEAAPGHASTGYEILARNGRAAKAMEWCWRLPDAPSRPISPLSGQVDCDELVGRLAVGAEPMSKRVVESLENKGVGLFDGWSDGRRPFDMLMVHARPGNVPLSRSVGESARAPHEWLAILRDIASVGRGVIKNGGSKSDLLGVRSVLWANAHYASMRGSSISPPEWLGTLIRFDREAGDFLGWDGKGDGLASQAHSATLDWLVAKPDFAHARLAMEVSLAETGEFTSQLFGSPSPTLQAGAILDVAGRLEPVVSSLVLGAEPPGSPGRGWDPWRRAWSRLTEIIELSDSSELRKLVAEDPRIWQLALPYLAIRKKGALRFPPQGSSLLELALNYGNEWPAGNPWQPVMESRGWSEAVRSKAVERGLDLRLPKSDPSPSGPRL